MKNLYAKGYIKKTDKNFELIDPDEHIKENQNTLKIEKDLKYAQYYYETRLPLKHKWFKLSDFKILGKNSRQKEGNQMVVDYLNDFSNDLLKNIFDGRNILISGSNRSGKTILACGLCTQIVQEFYDIKRKIQNDENFEQFLISPIKNTQFSYETKELKLRFYQSTEILNLYYPTFKSQADKKEELYNCEALFIEGLEKLTEAQNNLKVQALVELLNHRHFRKLFTIITTTMPETEFENKMGKTVKGILNEDYKHLMLHGEGLFENGKQ